MKAWDDIEAKRGSKIYSTSYSRYWIEKGIKIEKMNTGEVVVRNCLIPGDDCELVSPVELNVFEHIGWDQGVNAILLDHLKMKLIRNQFKLTEEVTRYAIKKRELKIQQIIDSIQILRDEMLNSI